MWTDPATGRKHTVQAFVMVLACSRYMFVRLVLRMDQEAWTRCHVEAFAFFDGVPARYVGAPPRRRNVTSRAAITLGAVLSRIANTTRNRDHASHAQNNVVLTPSMTGPSPKSYCSHYADRLIMPILPSLGGRSAGQR